jgi:hypothetical protein
MAEVVSAVMGADEIQPISFVTHPTPTVSSQNQEKSEPQAAQQKEDDGYGELFLF